MLTGFAYQPHKRSAAVQRRDSKLAILPAELRCESHHVDVTVGWSYLQRTWWCCGNVSVHSVFTCVIVFLGRIGRSKLLMDNRKLQVYSRRQWNYALKLGIAFLFAFDFQVHISDLTGYGNIQI